MSKLQVRMFTIPARQTRAEIVAHAWKSGAATDANVYRTAGAETVRSNVSKAFNLRADFS